MKKALSFLAISIFLGGSVSAQENFKCGLNQKLAKMYAENPQLEKDHEKLFLNGLHTEVKNGEKITVFTIPIVFHIIHTYGSENITDAQVLDQVAILNRDFRLMNADTADVVPSFKQIYGDVGIEFKLASIDPYGNCTNGIEHIYSHEAYVGDDFSKLNQWYRDRYLNVWVVASMQNGVAGYAFYPTDTEGSNFFRDGIIILDNYIGSIGTGSPYNSRALTHEIGHYLGLSHPWGSTNEPGVACGDDYINDTPITKGSNLNCNLSMAVCDPAIIENVQNYMDYSYCSRMFTLDQVSAMRNIIQGDAGKRNKLITPENHTLTGVDLTSTPVCKPIADFNATKRFTCIGSSVAFKDASYNAPASGFTYNWSFQDATPATSTSATPSVVFNSPGYKTVTLIVSNASGADTLEMENYIYVSEDWANIDGPRMIDMEDDLVYWFRSDNVENNYAKFQISPNKGYNNSRCYVLNNYKNTDNALAFSDDYFYYNRLGGSVDNLITPSFNLANTSNASLTFKYAYASNGTTVAEIKETLKIYSSKDCGQTWTLRKTMTGSELLSAGYASNSDFIPVNNNAWKTATINYTTSSTDVKTRFKFEFTATDLSSNLYIDDINVGGTLGLTTNSADALEVVAFPNPSKVGQAITIQYHAQDEPVTFTLRDIQGKVLSQVVRNEMNQEVTFELDTNQQLSSACYFLEVQTGNFKSTKKIIVM